MPFELSIERSPNHLIDYIFLLRSQKFSKSGLIKLFRNPEMEIAKFQEYNKEKINNFLLRGKQLKLNDHQKLTQLFNSNFSNEDYNKIKKMVKTCLEKNITILTPNTSHLPIIFKEIPQKYRDLIFVKGSIIDNDIKSYSICGTRNPTQDAIEKTKKIAEFFAEMGYTLINGFAKGVDIEGFIGASKKNGRYIGVLASGVENIYPPENLKYIDQVLKNGALVSQRLIWNRVNQRALQMRNRFSAQLSLGSIFIEGNYKSGTKWQYKFAKELNKPVFYLEPKDWRNKNAHIPKMIKEQGGIEIKNDLSNLNDIYEILEGEYNKVGIY
ncbi:MAG: DNA-processing protein DprA [Promethearchaeota archaeon]